MATTPEEVLQAAKGIATGIFKGNTADTLGAPVDLINSAISPITKTLGIHSETPFGGSAHFRDLFGMAPDKNVAETAGTMISAGGVAKAMIVGAARLGKAGKVDIEKATELFKNHAEVKPASVYNLTGVYKGEDGGLRSVISDKGANIKPSELKTSNPVKLDQLLDHPELFGAYPELRSIDVVADFDKITGSASYTPALGKGDNPTIKLSASDVAHAAGIFQARGKEVPRGEKQGFGDPNKLSFAADGVDKILSPLLHETQHAIQNIEKWAPGGSPRKFLPPNVEATSKAVQKAVTSGRNSPDSSVRAAAERFKDRFNNKVKDAHTKYENIPGEQEARFTQETRNQSTEELAGTIRNMLRQNVTPQSFDTQPLPSAVPPGVTAPPATTANESVLERVTTLIKDSLK